MNSSKIFIEVTKYLIPLCKTPVRNCTNSPQDRELIVTILDASTKIGRNLALLLKQSPHVKELRLHDKNCSVYNIAEDLSHIDTRVKVKSFGGRSAMKYAILVSKFTNTDTIPYICVITVES